MTKCSFKSRVSSRDLQIRFADSGERYAHERLAVCNRLVDVSYRELLIFVTECLHGIQNFFVRSYALSADNSTVIARCEIVSGRRHSVSSPLAPVVDARNHHWPAPSCANARPF